MLLKYNANTLIPHEYRTAIETIFRDGSNQKNSHLHIAAFYSKDLGINANAHFLKGAYLSTKKFIPGGKGFIIGDRKISVWFDANGILFTCKHDNLEFSWGQASLFINSMINEGKFTTRETLSAALENERREMAERIWFFYKDDIGEMPVEGGYHGFPEDTAKIQAMLENSEICVNLYNQIKDIINTDEYKSEQKHWHNAKDLLYDFKNMMSPAIITAPETIETEPFTRFISDAEINYLLMECRFISCSKADKLAYFVHNTKESDRAKWLSDKSGTGGGSWHHVYDGHYSYNTKGMTFSRGNIMNPYAKIALTWADVARRLNDLILNGIHIDEEDNEADTVPAVQNKAIITDRSYEAFLQSKRLIIDNSGFDIEKSDLNPLLYDFEKDITRWALKKGKACIFADCGLGKTLIQLAWAHHVHMHTGDMILILAPLSVVEQTYREALKFGYEAKVCETQSDCINGINITNYEKLEHFVSSEFIGIVLDESSILKSYSGKLRKAIIDNFAKTPYRLACTATPAPNDYMEIGNHAEFCGVMTRSEMLSMYFVHDGGETSKWRLKGHAEDIFWEWLASFSVFIDNPKNLGYNVDGYDLPPLSIHEIIVDGDIPSLENLTLAERRNARKDSLDDRCKEVARLVNGSDEQWLVWCDLNCESEMLHSLINESVEIKGSDSQQHKSSSMLAFSDNQIKCLVTKPSIAGFGMNWQNCRNMIFTGLSDSYEQFYQAVRRCYRFGQAHPVNVYIIISAREGCVKDNIDRKQKDFLKMQSEMIKHTKEITKKELERTTRKSTLYEPTKDMVIPNWEEFVA